jgi:tetratricopeptide (TPR) repeat protein
MMYPKSIDIAQDDITPSVDPFYYVAKAQVAIKEDNLHLVLENLVMAHSIVPDEIDILAAIAEVQVKLEHWKQMLPILDLLINLQPDELNWRVKRLAALMSCENYEQVVKEALPLLETYPKQKEILDYLVSAYYHSNNFSLGLIAVNNLVELDPGRGMVLRGLIYRSLGDKERAKTDLLKAESMGENSTSLLNGLGSVYTEVNEHEIALDYYCKALLLADNDSLRAQIALNASFSAMCLGDFDRGWQFYAYRKYTGVTKETSYPAWQGESLSGKHLVIRREQGLGDQIRFASLIPEIANEARSLTLECDPRLIDLYQRSFSNNVALVGVPETGGKHDHGDSYEDVNYAAHIGDLAHYKRRSLGDFPEHYGYLQPDPKRVSYWSDYLDGLGGKLNVGVSWKSGNTTGIRSTLYTNIEHWLPVFAIEDINFVNIFYGDSEEELKWVEGQIGIKVHTPKGIDLKNDIDDLSALIASLDLVVGPHTAPIDLAMSVKGASAWVLPFRKFNIRGPFYFGQSYYPWAPATKPIFGDGFKGTMDVVADELAHIIETTDPKLTLVELSKIMYACYGAS